MLKRRVQQPTFNWWESFEFCTYTNLLLDYFMANKSNFRWVFHSGHNSKGRAANGSVYLLILFSWLLLLNWAQTENSAIPPSKIDLRSNIHLARTNHSLCFVFVFGFVFRIRNNIEHASCKRKWSRFPMSNLFSTTLVIAINQREKSIIYSEYH